MTPFWTDRNQAERYSNYVRQANSERWTTPLFLHTTKRCRRSCARVISRRTAQIRKARRWILKHPRLARALLALTSDGPERALALRWLPARWKLMIRVPSGPAVERARYIGAHPIPIFTRRAGIRRMAEFTARHPGDNAWLERQRGERHAMRQQKAHLQDIIEGKRPPY